MRIEYVWYLAFASATDHTTVYVPALAAILVAIISASGVTFAAMYPYRRRVVRTDRAEIVARDDSREKIVAIHEQVKNTHDDNLRDDLDQKFQALFDRFDKTDQRIDRVSKDIGGVKATQRTTNRALAAVTERLEKHIDGR